MRIFGWGEFLFIVGALRWTLLLSAVAFAGGSGAGFLIALAKICPFPPLRGSATLCILLFQGTPLLMQLFLAYYGLAVLTGLRIDAWSAVALAFTCYAAAYLGDI